VHYAVSVQSTAVRLRASRRVFGAATDLRWQRPATGEHLYLSIIVACAPVRSARRVCSVVAKFLASAHACDCCASMLHARQIALTLSRLLATRT
jgi:hypothetical protein